MPKDTSRIPPSTFQSFLVSVTFVSPGADRVLDALGKRAGRRFEYRSLYFFGLLLAMATIAFAIVRRFAPPG